jgi:hypothetical protein
MVKPVRLDELCRNIKYALAKAPRCYTSTLAGGPSPVLSSI